MRHAVVFAILLILRAPVYAGDSAIAQLRLMNGDTALPAPQAAAPTAHAPGPFILKEIERNGICYFYDASFEGVRRDDLEGDQNNPNHKTQSNVLVYAVEPTNDADGFVDAAPEVGVWTDERGHLHSVDVLRAQLAFNNLLLHQPNCNWGVCSLIKGRQQPLTFAKVPVSGILDSNTLMIPVLRLELEYDHLYTRFEAQCAKSRRTCLFGPAVAQPIDRILEQQDSNDRTVS